MVKKYNIIALFLAFIILPSLAFAVEQASQEPLTSIEEVAKDTKAEAAIAEATVVPKLEYGGPVSSVANKLEDPIKYTLGPDDVVEIEVMRHPEFSGTFPVNLEGKIQIKYVGDIDVSGLTKKELEQKIKEVVSAYVINPEITVTVIEYKSKVIYVLGEVGQPGKYFMRSETIPVREAVVQAGLPTLSAAMRKCRIITPDKDGKIKTRYVDLYSVLYGGNLRLNLDMKPGDVLYVPCTVMAKLIRMINPVTQTVQGAAAGPSGIATGKTSSVAITGQ